MCDVHVMCVMYMSGFHLSGRGDFLILRACPQNLGRGVKIPVPPPLYETMHVMCVNGHLESRSPKIDLCPL